MIIELFFERSEQAIRELSAKYGVVCARIARNILDSPRDCEECVNDAYLAVWNTIPPQRPDHLLGYLCRIVRNLSLKRYHETTARKRNSSYDLALDQIADCFPSSDSVEDAVDALEMARVMNHFLETLDRETRVLFVRRFWYADSIEDLADLFQTSRHNISVRLNRLRKALKKYLNNEGFYL